MDKYSNENKNQVFASARNEYLDAPYISFWPMTQTMVFLPLFLRKIG